MKNQEGYSLLIVMVALGVLTISSSILMSTQERFQKEQMISRHSMQLDLLFEQLGLFFKDPDLCTSTLVPPADENKRNSFDASQASAIYDSPEGLELSLFLPNKTYSAGYIDTSKNITNPFRLDHLYFKEAVLTNDLGNIKEYTGSVYGQVTNTVSNIASAPRLLAGNIVLRVDTSDSDKIISCNQTITAGDPVPPGNVVNCKTVQIPKNMITQRSQYKTSNISCVQALGSGSDHFIVTAACKSKRSPSCEDNNGGLLYAELTSSKTFRCIDYWNRKPVMDHFSTQCAGTAHITCCEIKK